VFTVNNFLPSDETLFKEQPTVRYLVYGRETGESGTPHLQGFIVFNEAKTLSSVKKIHPTAHWEIALGSPEQNRVYCTKQGDYVESGIIPISQKRKGDMEAERWDLALENAKVGNLDEIPADIRFRYYRTVKEICKDHMVKPPDLDVMDNYWIWGPPGSGKSMSARQRFPGAYFKLTNKWWDGYQGEENVIIDDVEKDHSCLGHHFKIWGDRYSFLAETKGGACHIRPKRIIITSNYCPEIL